MRELPPMPDITKFHISQYDSYDDEFSDVFLKTAYQEALKSWEAVCKQILEPDDKGQ